MFAKDLPADHSGDDDLIEYTNTALFLKVNTIGTDFTYTRDPISNSTPSNHTDTDPRWAQRSPATSAYWRSSRRARRASVLV